MKRTFFILIMLLFNLGIIFSQTHFTPVWDGNGNEHMNFYVTSATINGINIQSGDEIAVFDAGYCVGVGLYTGSYDVSVKASKDDDDPGVNGFRPGNSYSFQLWDASEGRLVTDVGVSLASGSATFSASATAFVSLTGTVPCDPVSAPTVSLTQPACGESTGTITITAPTGMNYSIDGSTYTNTSGVFSSVAIGSYTVRAKNALGCISSGTSATIVANPIPSIPSVSVTQPSCGGSTGTITVTAPTGMNYSINGSTYTNTTGIFTGVAIGPYTVTAMSSGGCISSGASATISANPVPSTPTVSLTQPTCEVNTGTITVTAPTGLNYSINGSTYTNTTGVFSGLSGNTYSVTARNTAGCTSLATSAIINANPVPSAPSVTVTQPSCGGSTGTITVTAPTGMNYSINGSTYTNTTGIFSGVAIGTYTVTAMSSGGCTSSGTSATISDNPVPSAPAVSVTQPACGVSTGTITVTTPTGMNYSINGSTYTNTTGIFSGVAVGSYSVTARSSGGCTSSVTSASIIANPLPSTPSIAVTQPSCGGSTGTITVTAPTGLNYSINGSTYTNTTGIFTGVAIGPYTVTARNTAGCTSSGTSATISANPIPSTPSVSVTQPSCGGSTGTITVTAPTGMNYSINGSTYTNTTGIFSGVAIGPYTVTAMSSGGCTSSGASAIISANPLPSTPTVSLIQPTCEVSTGTITVTAPTGLNYSINGSTYTNTTGVFSGLSGNTYSVTARNTAGCTSLVTSAIITANPVPSAPSVSVTQPSCGGSTGTITVTAPTGMNYSINGSTYSNTTGIFSGVAIGTYTVTAMSSGGCTSSGTSATISDNPVPSAPAVSVTQPACGVSTGTITVTTPTGMNYSINGSTYTNTTGIFSGVAVGSYSVTARSSGGCTSAVTSASIIANPLPSTPSVAVTQPSCGGSTGTITVTAPTSMNYSIDGSTYTNTTGIFPGVAIGPYTVTARNTAGCTSSGTSATIAANPVPSAPLVGSITQPTCAVATGSVNLSGLSSSGSWSLTRNPGGVTSTGLGTAVTLLGIAPGIYTYSVTNASGCTSQASGNVTINAIPETPSSPTIGTITQPTCSVATGSVDLSSLPSSGAWTLTKTPGGTLNGTGTSTTISDLAAGSYTFMVTNAAGCASVSSENVVIDAQPAKPATPIISRNGNVLHTDAANGNQWFNSTGSINTATSQDFTPTANGNYYVIVTLEGCQSDPSNTINFILSAIEQPSMDESIKLYPNPVIDELIIEIKDNTEIISIEILNSKGQVVFKGDIMDEAVVQTAGFAAGIYVVKLEGADNCVFRKIVKY